MCYNKFEDIMAVFKPCDEEPYCINNPKGLSPNRFYDRGISPGTACYREVAAYYLDFNHFAGVPETSLASITIESSFYQETQRKEGSFQLYIPHECSSEDYGPSMFSTEVSTLLTVVVLMDRMSNELLCLIFECSILIDTKTTCLS